MSFYSTCPYCREVGVRRIVRGSIEYLTGSVDANVEITDAMPVYVSVNRKTYEAATWLTAGIPNTHRHWQILMPDDLPLPDVASAKVYVKVTDTPTEPIMLAGNLEVI